MATSITSLEQLKALYDAPKSASIKKQSATLTDAYRQWLNHSSFFVIASVGNDSVDCTPRGDELGKAFAIADSKTILIPDRRGNNRLETLSNLVIDPRIALLFFIPGIEQTLRVIGRATISIDPVLLERFTLENNKPVSCISVKIDAVYFQNARAIARSQLWQSQTLSGLSEVPSPGEMIKSVDPTFDADSYEAG